MNAIVLSAIFGVIMMFTGIFTKNRSTVRYVGIMLMALLLTANIAEQYGYRLFNFNTRGMLSFTSFGLLFNSIALGSTLIYYFLSSKDMERVGIYLAEYFALIFFVLCGVAVVSSFNTLLMLFLGIEIISIPLYILTGTDKRNLKSNEAALKYFLMGSFSTGLLLMGITLLYGTSGSFNLEVIMRAGAEPNSLFMGGIVL